MYEWRFCSICQQHLSLAAFSDTLRHLNRAFSLIQWAGDQKRSYVGEIQESAPEMASREGRGAAATSETASVSKSVSQEATSSVTSLVGRPRSFNCRFLMTYDFIYSLYQCMRRQARI